MASINRRKKSLVIFVLFVIFGIAAVLVAPWFVSQVGEVANDHKKREQLKQAFCSNNSLDYYIHDSGYTGPYLLVQPNAITSISINWISLPDNFFQLEFRLKGESVWRHVSPTSSLFESTDNLVHKAIVEELKSSSIYEFRIINLESNNWFTGIFGWNDIYAFQTPPENLSQPITFVAGGDMDPKRELMAATTEVAASTSPVFAVLGGDIAYDDGKYISCWYDWLDIWSKKAVTPQGLSIPILISIGNHDVVDGYGQTPEQAESFYSLFLYDRKSNYVVDFASYMSFYVLDSDHTQRVEAQNNWLQNSMSSREHVPHSFAVYHVPAYGILKGGFKNETSKSIRENWVPIFEQMDLNAAFENHHHIYKRSKLIFEESVNTEKGILYIGDGAWGKRPRKLPKDMTPFWYVAKTERKTHFLKVTVDEKTRTYEAIDVNGKLFDRFVDDRP